MGSGCLRKTCAGEAALCAQLREQNAGNAANETSSARRVLSIVIPRKPAWRRQYTASDAVVWSLRDARCPCPGSRPGVRESQVDRRSESSIGAGLHRLAAG